MVIFIYFDTTDLNGCRTSVFSAVLQFLVGFAIAAVIVFIVFFFFLPTPSRVLGIQFCIYMLFHESYCDNIVPLA